MNPPFLANHSKKYYNFNSNSLFYTSNGFAADPNKMILWGISFGYKSEKALKTNTLLKKSY